MQRVNCLSYKPLQRRTKSTSTVTANYFCDLKLSKGGMADDTNTVKGEKLPPSLASSLASSNHLGVLEKLLTCSICHESFCRPKALSCLHSFCYGCLEKWKSQETVLNANEIRCPECNQTTSLNSSGVAGLTNDFRIEGILQALQGGLSQGTDWSLCGICRAKDIAEPAEVHCIECGMKLCSTCNGKHSTHPAFSEHNVLRITSSELLSVHEVICSHHKRTSIKSCSSCSEFLCTVCLFEHPPDHKIEALDIGAVIEARKSLIDHKETLCGKMVKVNQELSEYKEAVKDSGVLAKVQKAIKERADYFVSQVRAEEKKLLEQSESSMAQITEADQAEALAFRTKLKELLSDIEIVTDGTLEEVFFRLSSLDLASRVSSLGEPPALPTDASNIADYLKFKPKYDGFDTLGTLEATKATSTSTSSPFVVDTKPFLKMDLKTFNLHFTE